jgi:hypothetical protein
MNHKAGVLLSFTLPRTPMLGGRAKGGGPGEGQNVIVKVCSSICRRGMLLAAIVRSASLLRGPEITFLARVFAPAASTCQEDEEHARNERFKPFRHWSFCTLGGKLRREHYKS